MFPPRHLDSVVRYTTAELEEKSKKKTTQGEILKFFGVIYLTTKFEFKSRASLWSTTAPLKYEVAPAFGWTGLSRQRFDDLWMCIRFSNQPKVRPPQMSSKRYRWNFVDDFVFEDEIINKLPTVSFQRHLWWTNLWLIAEADAHPKVVEPLA